MPDLKYKSHPDKYLEEHICGVVKKACKYDSSPVLFAATFFHDLGKINPNFQKKIDGISVKAYSRHSYLSVLAFYCYCKSNSDEINACLKAKNSADLRIKRLQVIALIASHHKDLSDMERLLNTDELEQAARFAKENEMPFADFIDKKLQKKLNHFLIDYSEKEFNKFGRYVNSIHREIWKQNALSYFIDTQFSFSALIYADKRDAGRNDKFQFDDEIKKSIQNLESSLSNQFQLFEQAENPTELNKLRTAMRIEATESVLKKLAGNKRIYTLTAPTGAGKTFMLLSVAKEIQRQKGNLGIIYALPFLSITEQVQHILETDLKLDYLPVSSKAQNEQLNNAQADYEQNPTKENLNILLQQDFAQQTFDHPFVITTFVQLFETLVSNKNSTLLKLPNFSNRIFLIDEIQSLPPRLYIFFSAWLDAFCGRHNSYAVLSTATMPKFDFPAKDYDDEDLNPSLLFKTYQPPEDLLDARKYFSIKIFNRYRINLIDNDNFLIRDLANHILEQEKSCLIILNTIGDTKLLFDILSSQKNVILLNTHFIPEDRTRKIEKVKNLLETGEKVILISTQLIEAGVDIDFPIVYRDLCPLPSLIQSAGRCNRNGKQDMGEVYFFQLKKENGKSSSEVIYKDEASKFLEFCKQNIKNGVEENQLFDVQSDFFDYIKQNLTIGKFEITKGISENMIKCVNHAEFEQLGEFQLINKKEFGEEYRYYIPTDSSDKNYDELVNILVESFDSRDYEKKRMYKIKIDSGLKKISNRIVNVRLKKNEIPPAFSNEKEYFGIRVLSDTELYNSDKGLELGTENLLL